MKMKHIVLAALLSATSFYAQAKKDAPAKVEPARYAIDASHSKVGFEVGHLVISTVEGRFTKFDGEIILADKFNDSKVTANVETASVDTSNADRDKHLRSADFFDSEKFPKMTFVSKKITGNAKSFKVVGDLTLHGVTKEIVLDGKYLGTAKDPYGNTQAAFKANGKINRKDFGLTWNKMVEASPAVGDEVTIALSVEGRLTK